MIATAPRRRGGFTLIELIAAMALAIVVTAMVVGALYSGAFGSQRVISSADRVGGWLVIAKQRALRNRTPQGVRFLRNQADTNLMTEALFIESPAPFVPNPGMQLVLLRTIDDAVKANAAFKEINVRLFVYIPTSDTTGQAEFTSTVQSGDLGSMRLPDGTTLLFRLKGAPTQVNPVATPPDPRDRSAADCTPSPSSYVVYELPIIDTSTDPKTTLPKETFPNAVQKTIQSVVGAAYTKFTTPNQTTTPAATDTNIAQQLAPTYSTTIFTFQPQSRPLFGEPILQLSPNAVIDARGSTATNYYSSLNVPGPGGTPDYFDVMFGPSGQVVNEPNGLIAFWIRDPDPEKSTGPNDYANSGEQVLVVLYTRSGSVSTQPVVVTGTDPYAAAKDGINAGF